MLRPKKQKQAAFTVVELAVVIMVIAVVATVAFISYKGALARARDTERIHDAVTIEEALKVYLVKFGAFPTHAYEYGTSASGWEASYLEGPGNFIKPLIEQGVIEDVPVDPINTSSQYYRYYVYPAGSYGCDTARGRYFVFGVLDMESTGRPHPDSPGWSCPTRNWAGELDWVTGEFEK